LYGGGFSSSPVGELGCSSDGLGCGSSSGVDGGDTVLRCASLLAAFSGGRGVEVLSGELTTFSSFGWEPSAPTPSTVIRFRWYTQGKLLSRPDELRMIFRYLLFNNPFTGVRGTGILRTSPFGYSRKFATSSNTKDSPFGGCANPYKSASLHPLRNGAWVRRRKEDPVGSRGAVGV
jgi:hypothetical protein